MSIELIKYDEKYMCLIEKWEKRRELFKYLSHTRPKFLLTGNEKEEKSTLFFMIKVDEKIIGAVWLEDITKVEAKLSIYIAEISKRGKGIGETIIKKLIKLVFNDLKLKKLYLHARETNTRAIKLYEKCGFRITYKYPSRHFSDGSYQGIYEMCLNF
ncbi:GNAT family N-acetyltransferase [Clostridium felsineum]|uniref:GNAT family N-acetyltransferase n=1 Tax=Clostridium felsineum TaxID=36839 RepID=UPI00098CE948|nr:GNAT family N-acetyltransferase [Clostridium felsineum]MCR3758700.1 GNAT family N-acetyltransferase [Clostridium felsineum]URZ18476.1 hypothetical protein CLFE_045640 [Clostridium felsineum DSM 794]